MTSGEGGVFRRRRTRPLVTFSRRWLWGACMLGPPGWALAFVLGRASVPSRLPTVHSHVSDFQEGPGRSNAPPLDPQEPLKPAGEPSRGTRETEKVRVAPTGQQAPGSHPSTGPLGRGAGRERPGAGRRSSGEAAAGTSSKAGESHDVERQQPPPGLYGIQVAAYERLEDAKQLVETHAQALRSLGSIYIVERQIEQQTWFRVRVGAFRRVRQARKARATLPSNLRVGSMVVRYP